MRFLQRTQQQSAFGGTRRRDYSSMETAEEMADRYRAAGGRFGGGMFAGAAGGFGGPAGAAAAPPSYDEASSFAYVPPNLHPTAPPMFPRGETLADMIHRSSSDFIRDFQ